ncbi:putative diguanylate cyclase YeaJ [Calidithermus terrae]|uniref:Putative diguanylate cyclase YeaJ n=2 Tax=Calidithermus terrae TaxID=1408545 RepID=A0A399E774_9DEIN|nr:putative diguanylate cyclase YeaJ [Calidithermus terrae]
MLGAIGMNSLESPQQRAYRLYWVIAALVMVPAVFIHPFFGRWPEFLLDGTYAAATVLGWWLARRLAPKPAITLHLVLGFLLATWYIAQPEGLPGRFDFREEAYVALVAPALLGLSVVWGVWGFALAVLMGFSRLQNPTLPEQLSAGYVLAFVALLGLVTHYSLRRLEEAHENLANAALQDPLTQLGNRRVLEADFVRLQALAKRAGVPLLLTLWDLDDLKAVNDDQGHVAGDAYIRDFAQALRLNVREGDGLYRLGGDEFCGLHLGLSEGSSVSLRVRAVFPNVSVGWSEALGSLDETLAQADQHLYAEKANKRPIRMPKLP